MNNEMSPSSLYSIQYRLDDFVDLFVIFAWIMILFIKLALNLSYNYLLILLCLFVLLYIAGKIQVLFNQKSEHVFEELSGFMGNFFAVKDYESNIIENIDSGKQIRIDNSRQSVIQNMQSYIDYMSQKMKRMYTVTVFLSAMSLLLVFFINLGIYLMLALLIWISQLSLSFIIPLFEVTNRLLQLIPEILVTHSMIHADVDYLKTYYDFMDLEDSKEVLLDIKDVEQIELNNLSYGYSDNKEILHNLNYSFIKGKSYAIVGPNGSGKTTLINLLQGLLKPTKGQVTMSDSLQKASPLYVNKQVFSYLQQHFELFNFKIKENIILNQTLDEDRLQQIITEIKFETILSKLDEYYGKEYDASGIFLSGGEQQKLLIGQVLYKNSHIIILDEPTSDLDAKMEAYFYQLLNKYSQDKTIIFISHRLASCKFCDEIIVLDNGEIIQTGTHEELLSDDGLYKQMWQAQLAL